MTSPRCDQTVAWAALGGHYQAHGADLDLRTLFADDPRRVEALGESLGACFAAWARAFSPSFDASSTITKT